MDVGKVLIQKYAHIWFKIQTRLEIGTWLEIGTPVVYFNLRTHACTCIWSKSMNNIQKLQKMSSCTFWASCAHDGKCTFSWFSNVFLRFWPYATNAIQNQNAIKNWNPFNHSNTILYSSLHCTESLIFLCRLAELIEYPTWRSLIYRLAEDYPDCLMLNFTIKLISDAGFQGEITSISTAAQQIEVFSR